MEILKKMWRAATIRAVIAAITVEPAESMDTLTNYTVPLNMMMPESNDQIGP